MLKIAHCRFCGNSLQHTFVDLGMSPLSNAYIKEEHFRIGEKFFPLHAYVCEKCFLVQLEEFVSPDEIFSDYAYFSSYSDSWLMHAKEYTDNMIKRFNIDSSKQIVELASNDGYLLQYFKEKSIPVLGIEPAANVAQVAIEKGVNTKVMFFGTETAKVLKGEGVQADLIIGNNVLAHVPDLNDFVEGFNYILKLDGIVTMEFPHLLKLAEEHQFDTIYHEHFSYFSFTTVIKVFKAHGFCVFDVDKLSTHGGSIRIYACFNNLNKSDQPVYPISQAVAHLLKEEEDLGFNSLDLYKNFAESVKKTKRSILHFMINAKNNGKKIVAYGAAAKGNTLLNYCGIRNDFVEYVVDKNPHKQGLYLPGTHIPIKSPDVVRETKPDYLIILPWNLKNEIMEQMEYIKEWGGQFVIPIPEVKVI